MWKTLERLEGIGVASVSLDGDIIRCNNAFGVLLSDDKIHLAGKNIVSLTAPEGRARARECLTKLAAGEVHHVRVIQRFISGSGDEVSCRVLKMSVDGSGEMELLYWAYEREKNDSDTKRVEKLESLLERFLEIVYRSNGRNSVDIKMVNSDSSQNANADHGGVASIQNVNQKAVMIAMLAVAALIALGVAALVFGGRVHLKHGDSEIEIRDESLIEKIQ